MKILLHNVTAFRLSSHCEACLQAVAISRNKSNLNSSVPLPWGARRIKQHGVLFLPRAIAVLGE